MTDGNQNRAIEIHDSTLDAISQEGGYTTVYFRPAYIHQSSGEPGVDPGSGWIQHVALCIKDATVIPASAELPGKLLDGRLAVGTITWENEIPIRDEYIGELEVELQTWHETVVVMGTDLQIKLLGHAKYVEEFPRNS